MEMDPSKVAEEEEKNQNFIANSLNKSTIKRDAAMAVRLQKFVTRERGVVSIFYCIFSWLNFLWNYR